MACAYGARYTCIRGMDPSHFQSMRSRARTRHVDIIRPKCSSTRLDAQKSVDGSGALDSIGLSTGHEREGMLLNSA